LFGGNSVAVYAQMDKKFFNRLSLTAGLRWEGFFIDTTFTPTPPIVRFGANYILNERNHLRASFGQGFRFPSLAERFINERLPVGGMEIGLFPNPNLKPEIGWSSELAYRYTYKDNNFRIYGDLALFWMEYRDMVEFVLDAHPEGLGFKTINVSQARIAGWEVSAQSEGKIGKFPLRIWGGYTYSYPGDMQSDSTQKNVGVFVKNMFNTFVNGVDMTNTAEIVRLLRYRSMHNVRFDVETDVRKFTFGAVANYNSYVHRIDLLFALGVVPGLTEFRSQRTKGDWVFDLRMAYRFNDRQRLSFVVGNVANRVYENRPARLSAPRTFSIKYQQQF
jgi:iron complex outermembrane receptor protein